MCFWQVLATVFKRVDKFLKCLMSCFYATKVKLSCVLHCMLFCEFVSLFVDCKQKHTGETSIRTVYMYIVFWYFFNYIFCSLRNLKEITRKNMQENTLKNRIDSVSKNIYGKRVVSYFKQIVFIECLIVGCF